MGCPIDMVDETPPPVTSLDDALCWWNFMLTCAIT